MNPVNEIDLLLVKRRRFRPTKACYPCRKRKVKCDLNQPCGSCERRGHPDLCDYTLQASSGLASIREIENLRNQPCEVGSSDEGTGASEIIQGLFVDSCFPYASKVHLGSDSLPNFLSAYQTSNLRKPHETLFQLSLESSPNPQTIFELVCLQDSSSNFPFINLWRPEDGPERVYSALPEDEALIGLLRFCQASLFRILPLIVNFSEFESTLWEFLNERAKSVTTALETPPPGCTPSWFALLFGILACGAQLASSGEDSDAVKARVFACCSFQCLRTSNFLSFPNIQVIQALIMLVNFLRNQADAGASWCILGMTIRLAQSLGMHCVPEPDSTQIMNQRGEAVMKRYIWRSLIWQDTLVSLCYDRPCGITVLESIPEVSPSSNLGGHRYSFADSCHHLFVTANKISQALINSKFTGKRLTLQTIANFRNVINGIEIRSAPHLQDISLCQIRNQSIEHHAFRMFSDSVVLCLCRPAMLSSEDDYNKELTDLYLSRCRSVLYTYLELLRLNCPIRRSWVFVHGTLSCALSLGLAPQTQEDDDNKALLRTLFGALSQATICAGVPAYENALEIIQKTLNYPKETVEKDQ